MSKTNVKILWLYEDLLDLYGDRGNIMALTYQLRHLKVPYSLDRKSIFEELDFEAYDLIYAGPGKDKNLLRACRHLAQYGSQVSQAVEQGKVFFVTGNAQLLFGREILDEAGNRTAGAGLFDYCGRLTGEVFINDMVVAPVFEPASLCYGFMNRTSYMEGTMPEPLFAVRYSEKNIGSAEGILHRNFFGTWALGPVLAKNPALLKAVLCRVLGAESLSLDDGLQELALEKTLAEFSTVLHS